MTQAELGDQYAICDSFFASIFIVAKSMAFDRYTAHGGPIKGLAHSTELNLLVSTSFDYTAVVWDTESMTELKQLIGHNAAVNTATFSLTVNGSRQLAMITKSCCGLFLISRTPLLYPSPSPSTDTPQRSSILNSMMRASVFYHQAGTAESDYGIYRTSH